MPKHSLIALVGFARSTAAAATTYTDQMLAEHADPRNTIAEINALSDKVVATDREVRALQTQAKAKVAELRRLKRELYNKTSSLVDLGSAVCGGRWTPQGQEFAALRKKLRRRRSPQRPTPSSADTPAAGTKPEH